MTVLEFYLLVSYFSGVLKLDLDMADSLVCFVFYFCLQMSSYKRKAAPSQAVVVYNGRTGKRRRVYAPYVAPKYLGGPRGGELKFFDVDIDDAVVAATAITDSVNKIAQGITEVTRIGRKCTIKSIHWRYQITLPEQDAVADPALGDTLRVILYVDKQCNGATIAATDLLETANFQSFRNLANSGRFNILCDKTHSINYTAMASDGAGLVSQSAVNLNYVFNKRLDVPIEFNAAAGAITEIRSNNIGVLLTTGNGLCGFFSAMRLRFSDN